MMKMNNLLGNAVGLCLSALFLVSCSTDDDNPDWSILMPNALVTVKHDADGDFYLQLDDNTTLLPVNVKSSPYDDKQVRALVNFSLSNEPAGKFDKAVHINWMDSIRTKATVPDLMEENDNVYGNDPVEIVKDWVTVVEDGYLTLRFRTLWSNPGITHFVNLVTGTNPDDPYEVEFRHDANGDTGGTYKDGLVAFSLDALPDTGGETVKLKLKWNSFSGEKSVEFDYCSNKSSANSLSLPDEWMRPE